MDKILAFSPPADLLKWWNPKKKTGDRTENEISSRANYQEQTRRCFLLTSPHLESDFTRSKLVISNRAVLDRCCFCLHLSRNTTSERGEYYSTRSSSRRRRGMHRTRGRTHFPSQRGSSSSGRWGGEGDGLEVGKEEEGYGQFGIALSSWFLSRIRRTLAKKIILK
jgi:hypothetical protein